MCNEIHSVSDLLSAIKITKNQLSSHDNILENQTNNSTPTELWFRGQSTAEWDLKPGFHRILDHCERTETDYLNQFRQITSNNPIAFKLDKWGWLTFAQHHMLPTRLLDWSTQPLIALFFACQEQSKPTIDPTNKNGALYILPPTLLNIRARKAHEQYESKVNSTTTSLGYPIDGTGTPPLLDDWDSTLDKYHPRAPKSTEPLPPIAVRAPLLFERIIFQSGTFTIHPRKEEEGNVFAHCVMKYIIPDSDKNKIMAELSNLGISEFSIYRDLDRAAKHIRGLLS